MNDFPDPHPQKKITFAASEVLVAVVDNHTQDTISFGELFAALHERGFALLMAVFALPHCIPVPMPPGPTEILSIPLLFFTVQMLMGRDSPWLPAWLAKYSLKRSLLALMVEKVAPKLRLVESVLKARIRVFNTPAGEKVVACMWLLFCIVIALPIPGANFLPGVGVLISSLGLLSEDGLVVMAGFVLGLIGCFMAVLIVFMGYAAVSAMLPFF